MFPLNFLVQADYDDLTLRVIDLIKRDPNDVYDGNANISAWLDDGASKGHQHRTLIAPGTSEELSSRQLNALELLALPLGFVFGSAIASTLLTTTTTTTTTAAPSVNNEM